MAPQLFQTLITNCKNDVCTLSNSFNHTIKCAQFVSLASLNGSPQTTKTVYYSPISSGMDWRLFSPALRNWRFVKCLKKSPTTLINNTFTWQFPWSKCSTYLLSKWEYLNELWLVTCNFVRISKQWQGKNRWRDSSKLYYILSFTTIPLYPCMSQY